MPKVFETIALVALLAACSGGGDASSSQPVSGPSGPLPPSSIRVEGNPVFTALGDSVQLRAVALDRLGGTLPDVPVFISVNQSSVVSVRAGGWVRAVGNGEALLTFTAGSVTASLVAQVRQEPAVISVSPTLVELVSLGESRGFFATAADRNGNAILLTGATWSISDPSIASLTSNGTQYAFVVAQRNGVAVLRARVGALTGQAEVRVQQRPTNIFITPLVLTLNLGQSSLLLAEVTDASGKSIPEAKVQWTSLSPSIATVDTTGVVRAIASGNTQVVARSGTAQSSISVFVR